MAFVDGGLVEADSNNEITVAPSRRYQLTASDTIAGVIGLADGEFCQITAPASGFTTLEDSGTTAAGQALELSGSNQVIESTDETVYMLTRVGSAIRFYSGGASALKADLASTSHGKGAALVGSEDVGGYYNGTTVEAQLQEVGGHLSRIINIDDYSTINADTVELFDCTINGTTTVSSAGYTFTNADIGKRMMISRGKLAGTNLDDGCHYANITSISSGNAILDAAPDMTIAGRAHAVFGNDDLIAIQQAYDDAQAAGGGVVSFGRKNYWISSSIDVKSAFTTTQFNGARIYGVEIPMTLGASQSKDNSNFFNTPGKAYIDDVTEPANYLGSTTLSTDANEGDYTITVASSANMEPGAFIFTESTETAFTNVAKPYGIFDLNIIDHVEGTTLWLRYAVRKTMAISGESVTVKAYGTLKQVNFQGPCELVGRGYDIDLANGVGNQGILLRCVDECTVRDVTFRGINAHSIYPEMSSNVVADNCTSYGRDPEVAQTSDKNTNHYLFAPQRSRDCEVRGSKAYRVRHLFDAYGSIDTRAYYNTAYDTNTSAFTCHNFNWDVDIRFNKAYGCYQGVLLRGWSMTIKNNEFIDCEATAILGVQSPNFSLYDHDWEIENNRATSLGARGCYVSGPCGKVRIRNNEFEGFLGGVIRVARTDTGHRLTRFEIINNTAILTDTTSTNPIIEILDSTTDVADFASDGFAITGNGLKGAASMNHIYVNLQANNNDLHDVLIDGNYYIGDTTIGNGSLVEISGATSIQTSSVKIIGYKMPTTPRLAFSGGGTPTYGTQMGSIVWMSESHGIVYWDINVASFASCSGDVYVADIGISSAQLASHTGVHVTQGGPAEMIIGEITVSNGRIGLFSDNTSGSTNRVTTVDLTATFDMRGSGMFVA